MKVAEGYGRNYLLPRKLAIVANEGNKAVIGQMKAASVRRSAKEKTQAEELAKQLSLIHIYLALMAILAGWFEMNYLAANCVAIALCSILNFLLSETWVFAK